MAQGSLREIYYLAQQKHIQRGHAVGIIAGSGHAKKQVLWGCEEDACPSGEGEAGLRGRRGIQADLKIKMKGKNWPANAMCTHGRRQVCSGGREKFVWLKPSAGAEKQAARASGQIQMRARQKGKLGT